jgi:hypothetical protein
MERLILGELSEDSIGKVEFKCMVFEIYIWDFWVFREQCDFFVVD